jgi:hypothetical protein
MPMAVTSLQLHRVRKNTSEPHPFLGLEKNGPGLVRLCIQRAIVLGPL